MKKKAIKEIEIDLQTGEVFKSGGSGICVTVHNEYILPLYDCILAKALTIAYAAKKISTL